MVTFYDQRAIDSLKRITNPGSLQKEVCINFLSALHGGKETFINHIENIIKDGNGELCEEQSIFIQPSIKFSENEFLRLPKEPQKSLWKELKKISPLEACRPGLWLYLNLEAIKNANIKAYYLVGEGNGSSSRKKTLQTLKEVIDKPRMKRGENPAYLYYTRLALRRLFGSISERGIKALFNDAPFSKIYWRNHLAEEIAKGIAKNSKGAKKSFEDIVSFFHKNDSIYQEFVMRMSSKLTVIGDPPIRDPLIQVALEKQSDMDKKKFEALVRYIGIASSSRALGALPTEHNYELIDYLSNI